MEESWYSSTKEFFSNLSLQHQRNLFALGEKRALEKDEMVFHIGSPSDDIFLLLDGRVKIYELSREGKELILWFCFPGELFGLAEVVRRESREVNAEACSYVELLVIRHADFEQYLTNNPEIAMHVIGLLSRCLRELGDVLLNLASDDVTSRVIKLITRLSTRYGKPFENGIYLDIPLTHQEMADMIGTSRQTVTTVLGALRRKGILRTEQRNIYIQNSEWLESFTGKCERERRTGQNQKEPINVATIKPIL